MNSYTIYIDVCSSALYVQFLTISTHFPVVDGTTQTEVLGVDTTTQTDLSPDPELLADQIEIAEVEKEALEYMIAQQDEILADVEHRLKRARVELERMQADPAFFPRLVEPSSCRRKTLILDLNGLLVHVARTEQELRPAVQHSSHIHETKSIHVWYVVRPGVRSFMEECLRLFHLTIWTSRTSNNAGVLLRSMESQGYLPLGIASGQVRLEPNFKRVTLIGR